MTLVITYRMNTVNHETGVHTITSANDPLQTVEEYQAAHPDRKVMHAFDADDDILTSEKTAAQKFASMCEDYGFEPSDYNRTYHTPNDTSDVYKFIGFRPHNRKYKCIAQQIFTGETIKATPAYIKRMLTDYPA